MPDYHRRYQLDPLIKSKRQLQYEALLKQRVRATGGAGRRAGSARAG